MCFLSEWICLSQAFHINEIMQCVAFDDWLLSLGIGFPRFILIVAGVSASFGFITEGYFLCPSCLSVYHSVDTLVVSESSSSR